jgi:mannose-6-phosphate isomerase-like protein (cupin superfamily)
VFRKGAELYDERFGESYVLLETAKGTGGELVRIEDEARPGPSRRPASAHPRQEERFEVVSGTLGLTVDGEEERLLGPGESFVVRAEARHLPRNAGEGELRFAPRCARRDASRSSSPRSRRRTTPGGRGSPTS